jgi:hypothetical protein
MVQDASSRAMQWDGLSQLPAPLNSAARPFLHCGKASVNHGCWVLTRINRHWMLTARWALVDRAFCSGSLKLCACAYHQTLHTTLLCIATIGATHLVNQVAFYRGTMHLHCSHSASTVSAKNHRHASVRLGCLVSHPLYTESDLVRLLQDNVLSEAGFDHTSDSTLESCSLEGCFRYKYPLPLP